MRHFLLRAVLLLAPVLSHAAPVAVHEWGTFTVLQDEDGKAVSGINTDDEPVPDFVHDIARGLLIPPTEAPPSFFQGAPSCHPDVTMRLETPVLYVHAAEGETPMLDVKVQFRGGWLTQFFPEAKVTAPNIDLESGHFGHLLAENSGVLHWPSVAVNAPGVPPETAEHVWLAPRAVQSSLLRTADGECEKFLFYRGVAHAEAPLRVIRRAETDTLELQPQARDAASTPRGRLWLVEIRAEGTGAFRVIETAPNQPWPAIPASFPPEQYRENALPELRGELHRALVREGLFADEAEALLNTWELSYFKSAGLRLFFIVPRAWVAEELPLTITPRVEMTRVMIGRIELVTPSQRALLRQIAAGPVPSSWKDLRVKIEETTLRAGRVADWNRFNSGQTSLKELGITPPPVYQAYLDLGRFRNALILDEQRRRPTPELTRFIAEFQLHGYAGVDR